MSQPLQSVTQDLVADQTDTVCELYNAVVLDAHGEEREPWHLPGAKISRSFCVTSVIGICSISLTCFVGYRLLTQSISWKESGLYCMILSGVLGVFLPSPIRRLRDEQSNTDN